MLIVPFVGILVLKRRSKNIENETGKIYVYERTKFTQTPLPFVYIYFKPQHYIEWSSYVKYRKSVSICVICSKIDYCCLYIKFVGQFSVVHNLIYFNLLGIVLHYPECRQLMFFLVTHALNRI